MFYKLGIKQLMKDKRVLALSVLAIALGVGVFYTSNIATDTVQSAMQQRVDKLFGNVNYAVHRDGIQYYDNTTYGVPQSHVNAIRAVPGVEYVVARACASAGYYAPDDLTQYSNDLSGIDVENVDEIHIGIANITSYLPAIGTGIKTIEEVLNYTGVLRPVVVSDRISVSRGIVVGDKIRILPANATKLYANATEIAAYNAGNSTVKALIESTIRSNVSRMLQFTVTGIVIDGSEGPTHAVIYNEQSLWGLVPSEEALYTRMNDTLEYVHNRNYNNVTKAGEVGFFLVGTAESFSGGANAFTVAVSTATGDALIAATDIRLQIQGYIDYAMMMARTILIFLTIAAWMSCAVLIKTNSQMNLEEKMRELGILRAIGFKKKYLGEIVVAQLGVMIGIGVGLGLVIGIIPPQFFDVSGLTQFLSYNKVYAMDTVTVSISLVSTIVSIASGIALPLVSGLVPLVAAQKRSIVEMMSPSYMRQSHSKTTKKRGLKI
jgi:ABC-type antimicrobial peptide transport system permease subunit